MTDEDPELAERAERVLRSIVAHPSLHAAPETPGEAMRWALATIDTLRAGLDPQPEGDEVADLYAATDAGGIIPARIVLGPNPDGERAVVVLRTARTYTVRGAVVVCRAPGAHADVTVLEAHHPDQPGESVESWSNETARRAAGVLIRTYAPFAENNPQPVRAALEELRLALHLDENGDPR